MTTFIGRREFITLLGGAAAGWPLAVRAQQGERMRRIGVLMGVTSDSEGQARIAAFKQVLQTLGWTEGANVQINIRWTEGNVAERIRANAAELIGMAPDVILANGTPVSAALRRESQGIPIVFVAVTDPIGSGLVSNLARPGGNITGFTVFEYQMAGKWMEIIKETASGTSHLGLLHNPTNPAVAGFFPEFRIAAQSLAIPLTVLEARDAREIEREFDVFTRQPNGGMIVLPDPFTSAHRELIIKLTARHRVPTIYPFNLFAKAGGLVSYGPDILNLFERAASYVDRILKGTAPGDLPVEQPIKYELIVNLKSANMLGLEVPATLLARADEVIE
jgi:putative ABC transport system substrate-binding protein